MNPILILGMANAALAFLEKAIPQIRSWRNSGEVTAAQQNEVMSRYQNVKKLAEAPGERFDGEQWKDSAETGESGGTTPSTPNA